MSTYISRQVRLVSSVGGIETYVVHWFLLVQVVQTYRNMSRPQDSQPNSILRLQEMGRKHAVEFALDPVDPYPVWEKIVAGKAVPLFSITDPQSKVFDWR